MPIQTGALVRIREATADLLVAPFCHYAHARRVGVVTEPMKDGVWRVTFEPDLPGAKPRRIVLGDRDLVPVEAASAAAREPTPSPRR